MTDFSQQNKLFAHSYNQQKALLKKVLSGKAVNCEKCRSQLTVTQSEASTLQVTCSKGCTQLTLEID